jgi:hypothetical protein
VAFVDARFGVAASAIHTDTPARALPCRLQGIFDLYGLILFNAEI